MQSHTDRFPLPLFLLLMAAFPASGQSAVPVTSARFHMERIPVQQITATLTEHWHIPNITADDYVLIVPHPPVLHSQTTTQCAMTINGTDLVGDVTDERSDMHRHIVSLHITEADIKRYPFLVHDLPVRIVYHAVLYRERIVSGPPATPIAPLDATTRRFALSATKGMDYDAPVFQQWLTTNDLHKKSSETDIDFAWRAFSFIKRKYFYHHDPKQDRAASKLCLTDNSDCGGLSGLFISVLRANGVPARNLTGRVALTAGPNDWGQHHVEADFFADGIGWVPVNIAPAVGSAERSAYMDIGRFNGDFLAFHADGGMVFDTLWFGKQTIDGEQGIYHSVRGPGNFDGATDTEDWQVTSSHL